MRDGSMIEGSENSKTVRESVEKWINNAISHHVVFGKEGEEKSKDILDRIEIFDSATDLYLEIQLKIEQEIIKWVHQIYQAILMTGVVGVELILLNFTLSNLKAITWITWSVAAMLILPLLFLYTREDTGGSWLLGEIQNVTGITRNFNDHLIIIYYITQILETRHVSTKPELR